MAITRAQQVRQMLKDGNFVMQGGVKNYLGKQETVSNVPLKWQSGPDKPSTELAYITKAEKDLLLKKDIHGSLKDGPNKGPEGIMSLDSAGDKDGPVGGFSGADVSAAERGEKPAGMSQKQADEFRGGAIAAGAGTEGKDDTAGAKREAEKIKRQVEKRKKEAAAAITKEEKKEARATRRKMSDLKKADAKKRRARINKILSGGFGVNNPYGLSDMELRDLEVLGYDATKGIEGIGVTGVPDAISGGTNKFFDDILSNALEKSDRLSGVNLETFQNRTLDDIGSTVPGPLLNILKNSGLLQPGMTRNRKFFSDKDFKSIFGNDKKSVLEAGKYTFDGKPITQAQFEMLSPAEMEMVYKDYDTRRKSGEIDAYGNPTPLDNNDKSMVVTDPCKGPNPPAYCFVNQDPTPDPTPVDPRANFYGIAPRFAGSMFDFSGMADGGRIGAAEGGIMDLETGRQMYFLGKLVKKASRAVKKIAGSKLGKAAILGGLAYFGGAGGGGFTNLLKKGFLKDAAGKFTLDNLSPMKTIGLASLASYFLTPKEDDDDKISDSDRGPVYTMEQLLADRRNPFRITAPRFEGSQFAFAADGGRIGYQEGSKEPVAKETMPLLDMGGQEMDLRDNGGFVPIGRMEKADDVPARLSKNEFVFTADAVRNAGDGDVDKGSEVMYNMMKNLESGGEVSEESQGLEGARDMFQTSKRLEEVL